MKITTATAPTSMTRVALVGLSIAWVTGSLGLIASAKALDSGDWEAVLQSHATRGGFDYASAKEDADSLAKLDRFLESVATMEDSEPLSSWLNAYNALVVKSVLARYPIDSVRSVDGFFDEAHHRVAGRSLTLDAIENEIIRQRFPDARIHAALNCGAVSCPPLHGHAFREASLDRVLDRLARAFVASNRHVRVRDGDLQVSELFFWFAGDFERDGGSVRGWIDRFDATDKLAEVPADAEISRIRYSWQLNHRARRESSRTRN